MRYKESKVGGWVIQPIKNEIWNGEYQLVFVGGKLIYGQKKNYPKGQESDLPNQKNRIIEKYHPSEDTIVYDINTGLQAMQDLYFSSSEINKLYVSQNEILKKKIENHKNRIWKLK